MACRLVRAANLKITCCKLSKKILIFSKITFGCCRIFLYIKKGESKENILLFIYDFLNNVTLEEASSTLEYLFILHV